MKIFWLRAGIVKIIEDHKKFEQKNNPYQKVIAMFLLM